MKKNNTAVGATENSRPLSVCATSEYAEKAKALAEKLSVELVEIAEDEEYSSPLLVYGENGLSLTGGGLEIRGDFLKMLPRLKPNNLNGEMLVKASRMKDKENVHTAVDATAGLGEDSFLLAAAGFEVTLFEYNPVIAALLADALERAVLIPELADAARRMQLIEGDSIEGMKKLDFTPDVIVLDPMFPERQKSALIKKKFQLLQQLEKPCGDEEELLSAAESLHPRKIVIKRPLKGPFLAGKKPAYSLSGKAIRYDCLINL